MRFANIWSLVGERGWRKVRAQSLSCIWQFLCVYYYYKTHMEPKPYYFFYLNYQHLTSYNRITIPALLVYDLNYFHPFFPLFLLLCWKKHGTRVYPKPVLVSGPPFLVTAFLRNCPYWINWPDPVQKYMQQQQQTSSQQLWASQGWHWAPVNWTRIRTRSKCLGTMGNPITNLNSILNIIYFLGIEQSIMLRNLIRLQ